MTDSTILYLDLMKRCLTHSLWPEAYQRYPLDRYGKPWSRPLRRAVVAQLQDRDLMVMQRIPYDPALRETGRDWPAAAHTMIGMRRLDNIQQCMASVLDEGVPGDVIETGVWRGGATIFMRAVLKAFDVTDRLVWVADSFEGLPAPDPERYPADAPSRYHLLSSTLAVSLEEVRGNFERYGLLDAQVRFLKGWFRDTLPGAPFTCFSVIRLDGDMYESTMEALVHLYPRLSPGGYVIIDDYGLEDGLCRRAVADYRRDLGIEADIVDIDGAGAFWRKPLAPGEPASPTPVAARSAAITSMS